MSIDSGRFLDIYAEALNTFDTKKIAGFFLPPTIFINDQSKKIIASEEKLEEVLCLILERFSQAGVKKYVPKLQQTMRLSDTLFFSKMRWQFYDEQDQLCFGCSASYTLQKMPDHTIKIIVVVIDDDEKALTEIFANVE